LLGVAPDGVYTAFYVTIEPVSSYLAFSSLPLSGHQDFSFEHNKNGIAKLLKRRLFSVALSLGSPLLDVI